MHIYFYNFLLHFTEYLISNYTFVSFVRYCIEKRKIVYLKACKKTIIALEDINVVLYHSALKQKNKCSSLMLLSYYFFSTKTCLCGQTTVQGVRANDSLTGALAKNKVKRAPALHLFCFKMSIINA